MGLRQFGVVVVGEVLVPQDLRGAEAQFDDRVVICLRAVWAVALVVVVDSERHGLRFRLLEGVE